MPSTLTFSTGNHQNRMRKVAKEQETLLSRHRNSSKATFAELVCSVVTTTNLYIVCSLYKKCVCTLVLCIHTHF